MEENDLINDNKKPLLNIDNDLIEMSKSIKIITSLKSDIEELIDKQSNSNINPINKNITLTIQDKYNIIKKQIQKFMNKKNYIYNFIRNENISNNNPININIYNDNNNDTEETEKLIEDNKMENVMQKIKVMQNEMKNKITVLDQKIKNSKIFETNGNLIDEINSNEINDINFEENNKIISGNKNPQYQSLLNAKAYKYNEETKELQNVVNKIEMLKQTTNHIKQIEENQGNNIEYLKDMNIKIEGNIEAGKNELIKRKNKEIENNKDKIICFLCLLFFITIFAYLIYNKFKKK